MPLIRTISLPLLAWVTVAFGVLFTLAHFYWAAGGTAIDSAGDTDAAQDSIGFIAVVGLLGAAVRHGFAHDREARLTRPRLTLLARARGAALAIGNLSGVERWLGGPIPHPAAGGYGPQIASGAAR